MSVPSGACSLGHYIEYRGFLSNHLSQYVTALQRMGAGEERVGRAVREYTEKLEGREGTTALQQGAGETGEVEGLLGKRRGYYHLVSHYTSQLEKQGSPAALVSSQLPGLLPGLGCAALHPLLQIGYGLAAGSGGAVVEGLAYLNHSYVGLVLARPPLLSRLGRGQEGLEEVLGKIQEDGRLRGEVARGAEEAELVATGLGAFQRKIMVAVTSQVSCTLPS